MLQMDLPAGSLNLAQGSGENRVLQIDLNLLQILPCGEPALAVLLQIRDPLQPRKDVLLQIIRARRLRAQRESAWHLDPQPVPRVLQRKSSILLQVGEGVLQKLK